MTSAQPPRPTPDEMAALFEACKNWGRWGDDDQRGALNHQSEAHRARAGALVRDGVHLSLAHDLPLAPSAEAPFPAHHHMLAAGDARDNTGIPGYEASRDWLGTDVHGLGLSHVDALCHMFVDGLMYNGRSAEQVLSSGSQANTVMAFADGIVGRGVLLDIAALRGQPHLDPAEPVTVADLEAAEARAGLEVGAGDILLVGTGRDQWRQEAGGTLNPRDGIAGLHPECLRWLFDREISVLGSDGISDAMPGLGIDRWIFPVHQVGIVAIGLPLLDGLDLGRLATEAAERGRAEFFFAVTPLRVVGGTGCPVNPVAVF